MDASIKVDFFLAISEVLLLRFSARKRERVILWFPSLAPSGKTIDQNSLAVARRSGCDGDSPSRGTPVERRHFGFCRKESCITVASSVLGRVALGGGRAGPASDWPTYCKKNPFPMLQAGPPPPR